MNSDKILFVNACIRPESRTYELAKHVLSHIPGNVKEVSLFSENVPGLTCDFLEHRHDCSHNKDFDEPYFDYAKDFASADVIVIAAPFWDLLFPAVLRNYLEAVTVSEIAFHYTPEGIPESLCKAKKLIYVTTSGGYIGEYNFGFSYVKALANAFYGISDVKLFSAEGLDIIGNDIDEIMKSAKAEITAYFTGNN